MSQISQYLKSLYIDDYDDLDEYNEVYNDFQDPIDYVTINGKLMPLIINNYTTMDSLVFISSPKLNKFCEKHKSILSYSLMGEIGANITLIIIQVDDSITKAELFLKSNIAGFYCNTPIYQIK